MTSTDPVRGAFMHGRVLFIGDSFATESLAKRIGERIREILPAAPAVERLGFPGGGLRQILPPARAALDGAPPTLVIHVYPDADAVRHWSALRRWRLKDSLPAALEEFSVFLERLAWVRGMMPSLAGPFERIYRALFFGEKSYREGIEEDLALLGDFAEAVEAGGHRYVCVFWDIGLYGLRRHFERRLATLNGQRTRVLLGFNDRLSVYQERDVQVSPADRHPNAVGENLFACYVAESLPRVLAEGAA